MLGTLPSADDVVSPLDARRVVLVHRGGGLLGEAHILEEVAKVKHLRGHPAATVEAEKYSSSAVDKAVVFCIFDRQRIGHLLHKHRLPDDDRREELLPQSESAKPESPSSSPERLRWVSLKLGNPARYSIRWWSAAQCYGPAEAQNRTSDDTV